VIKKCEICKIDLIGLDPRCWYCLSCRQALDTFRVTESRKQRRHKNPEPHKRKRRRKRQIKYTKQFQKKYGVLDFEEAVGMRQAMIGEKFYIPKFQITYTKEQRTKECRWCRQQFRDETDSNQRRYCSPSCGKKTETIRQYRKKYNIINIDSIHAIQRLIASKRKLTTIKEKLKEVI